jgi:hypothetical protein
VRVTCASCGTAHLIAMRARPLPVRFERGHRVLPVRVTAEPAAEVFARLWTESHRGPFVHRSA